MSEPVLTLLYGVFVAGGIALAFWYQSQHMSLRQAMTATCQTCGAGLGLG